MDHTGQRSRVDQDLGLLIHLVTSGLQRAFAAAALDGNDAPQLGPRHRTVLTCLDAEGTRATDVARQSGQHKQVVGMLIDELEQAGYVRRQPDPRDRRAKLIVPTDAGLQQVAKIEAVMAQIESSLATSMGERQYRTFKRSLDRVAQILSETAQA